VGETGEFALHPSELGGIREPLLLGLGDFYSRARFDPLIGPVFESKARDWEGHIARMCAFWSSVALMSGRGWESASGA
jgi:hemoglobin